MIKRTLAKLNQTMGFQISHSNKQKVKPFLGPETDHDNDDGTNGSVIGRLLSPPDVAGYASWLVNYLLFHLSDYYQIACHITCRLVQGRTSRTQFFFSGKTLIEVLTLLIHLKNIYL